MEGDRWLHALPKGIIIKWNTTALSKIWTMKEILAEMQKNSNDIWVQIHIKYMVNLVYHKCYFKMF